MEPETKPGTKKPRSKALLLTSGLLAVAAVIGSSTFFYLRRHTGQSTASAQVEISVLRLEPFVVNLADGDQRTFLRIGIELGVTTTGNRSKSTGTEAQIALIRDTILEILMGAKSDEISTTEGKRKLKEEMLQRLNARAPGLNVHEVYFTEFLIQK